MGTALYSVGIANAVTNVLLTQQQSPPLQHVIGELKTFFVEHSMISCPYYTGTLVLGKSLLAVPFLLHCLNGVRHLVWDAGYGLSLKVSYITGWTVVALTALGSSYLGYFA